MTFSAADLAVVIPTRDRWDVLARTLRGLRAQTVHGFSIVVVVDGLDQHAPELGPGVDVVVKAHAGPGAARNAGIRATPCPLVLLLGDDMIPAADLVERHLEQHQRHPEPELCVLGHVDWHPDAGSNRLQRWLDWSRTQYDFTAIDGSEAGAGHFYSSNVSAKRDLLLDVGGFDEAFPFVYEDIDLGFRLADRGMRLHYDRAARTRHLHRYSWPSIEGRWQAVGSGEHLMCAKHPQFAPYFLDRVRSRPRVAPLTLWPWLVDAVPARTGRLRRGVERRADAWYVKRLTTAFLTGWTAGAELAELRRYLGDDFDYPRLCGRDAPGDDDTAPDTTPDTARPGDRAGGRGALYDQTARAMAGRVVTVADDLALALPAGARVLHHPCGTGTLGLQLLEVGCCVTFTDVDGPALSYLRWRLAQRGHVAEVRALDRLDGDLAARSVGGSDSDASDRFDLAVATDLDDAADPGAVLRAMEHAADKVAVVLADRDAPRHADAPTAGPLTSAAVRKRGGRLIMERRRPGVATLVVYGSNNDERRHRARIAAHRRRRHRAPWPPVARG